MTINFLNKPNLKLKKNQSIYKSKPSIPQTNHFYEEIDDKFFPKTKEIDQIFPEEIGPGFYDPSFALIKPKIFVIFPIFSFISFVSS